MHVYSYVHVPLNLTGYFRCFNFRYLALVRILVVINLRVWQFFMSATKIMKISNPQKLPKKDRKRDCQGERDG